MNLLDKIAKTVVIRHVCHCDGAVEKPDCDEAKEHVFDVDGKEFPWFISERGPIVKRLADDLYSVDVEIMLVSKEKRDADGNTSRPHHWYLDFGYATYGGSSVPYIPVINGFEFPWLLIEDGCELRFGHKIVPALHLAFLAHEVDANIPIEDLRREPDEEEAIYCAGGDLIRGGKDLAEITLHTEVYCREISAASCEEAI
jgi:hypothetical protein